MKTITSSSNPTFKDAMRLHTSRGRKKQNRIVIFGVNEISRAATTGIEICQLFVCQELLSESSQAELERWIAAASESFAVPDSLFEKLSFGSRHDGVVAIATRPNTVIERIGNPQTIIVVEAIEKPGNLGAVFRSCDGAGVGAVIIAEPMTDVFHPNSIRASLGTVFSMPCATLTSADTIEFLARHNYQILAARLDASQNFFDCDLTRPSAIVLGNEASGLTKQWSANSCQGIRLPMLGAADSLNISATAAIVSYEALRQNQ